MATKRKGYGSVRVSGDMHPLGLSSSRDEEDRVVNSLTRRSLVESPPPRGSAASQPTHQRPSYWLAFCPRTTTLPFLPPRGQNPGCAPVYSPTRRTASPMCKCTHVRQLADRRTGSWDVLVRRRWTGARSIKSMRGAVRGRWDN